MKKFFCLLLCSIILATLVVPAFAIANTVADLQRELEQLQSSIDNVKTEDASGFSSFKQRYIAEQEKIDKNIADMMSQIDQQIASSNETFKNNSSIEFTRYLNIKMGEEDAIQKSIDELLLQNENLFGLGSGDNQVNNTTHCGKPMKLYARKYIGKRSCNRTPAERDNKDDVYFYAWECNYCGARAEYINTVCTH